MLAEEQKQEQDRSPLKLTIRVVERRLPNNDISRQPQKSRADGDGPLFEPNVEPASFAERFPHLMCFAVAATVFLVVLTAEIEYLRASGYYWP